MTQAECNREENTGVDAQIERLAYGFAGFLVNQYVETVSLFVGLSDDDEIRKQLLMKVRETELSKVDAIERQLGISPRTSQLRKWWRENGNGSIK